MRGETDTTAAQPTRRFGVLGPLEMVADGTPVALGPPKQRLALAVLLCRANEVVTVRQFMEALWEDDQPRTARKSLQVYLSALRKLVGDRVVSHGYGYRLRVEPDELDVLVFEKLAAAGRTALRERRPGEAAGLLSDALLLWRDHALADLHDHGFAAAQSTKLGERYLDVFEDWADAGLAEGGRLPEHEQLLEVSSRHPLRERLTAAAITALAREGRREAALGRYEHYRQLLSRELGLGPSPVLHQLYQSLLAGDASASAAASVRTSAARHVRPAQLPRYPMDFTGRTAELERVGTVLQDATGCGVALINGPIGAGKTALAVHAGNLARKHFADGQVFVRMTDRDGVARNSSDLLAELMSATGLNADPSRGPAALALWRSWIADKDFLIVLDDAIDEDCVADLLPGEGPSRVLVTSTRSLPGLEAVERIRINGLARAEAFDWLARALRQGSAPGLSLDVREREAAALAVRVVDRVGTLPLLLRAAAIAFADEVGRSGRGLEASWSDALPRRLEAVSVGGTTLRERYRRLDAGLSAEGRLAVRAIGRLAGPRFSIRQIMAELDDTPQRGARDVLAELLDAHVLVDFGNDADDVVSHDIGYTMPGLAHSYAADVARRSQQPLYLGPLPE